MNKSIRLKKLKNKKGFLLLTFLFVNICLIISLLYFMSPVSKKGEDISFIVSEGDSVLEIGSKLYKEGLIKNDKFFAIYVVLTNRKDIYAAKYVLNDNMKLSEIVDVLKEGGINQNDVAITFEEGINIRGVAKEISDNTNITYDEFIAKARDKKYLNKLASEYWFITKDVMNKEIYYPLEGYLFPDTYYVDKENSSAEDIFKLMLDSMDDKLSHYKKSALNSNYSIHQLITLASITQSEGYNEKDFKNIASVFYNRLSSGMFLGSCVTSYYGVKKDMTEELLASDINASNPYNTRGDNPRKFPVGPISMPGIKAIDAAFNPNKTSYYYFVSDKNHKLYFTKTLSEHEAMISNLESKGLWLEW